MLTSFLKPRLTIVTSTLTTSKMSPMSLFHVLLANSFKSLSILSLTSITLLRQNLMSVNCLTSVLQPFRKSLNKTCLSQTHQLKPSMGLKVM